jgi:hypothetical protein
MHPLDPDCPYIDDNLMDYLISIQQFFGFTSDGFVSTVLDYFHCLPGDSIPYTGYDCEQIVRDLFIEYQAKFMRNRFGDHPTLLSERESSLSQLFTPKKQLVLEEQPTGGTTVKLHFPTNVEEYCRRESQQQTAFNSEVPVKLSPAILVKKELRDSSVSSISSAGSGSHFSRSPVPQLDSRHPLWGSNVVHFARQRAGKNLLRPDFNQEGFEKTINKVLLSSHYPFTEEATRECIQSIVDEYVRVCAPEPFIVDLVSSDSSSISSTTLGSFANRNAQVEIKLEEPTSMAPPVTST